MVRVKARSDARFALASGQKSSRHLPAWIPVARPRRTLPLPRIHAFSPMSDRQELLRNAVAFLNDPKVCILYVRLLDDFNAYIQDTRFPARSARPVPASQGPHSTRDRHSNGPGNTSCTWPVHLCLTISFGLRTYGRLPSGTSTMGLA